jgi:hypothetical protein
LLRALGAGTATNVYDVSFNREVVGDAGRCFSSVDDVAMLFNEAEADRASTMRRGERSRDRAALYRWDDVAVSYENLCEQLAGRTFAGSRPSGRRRGARQRSADVHD